MLEHLAEVDNEGKIKLLNPDIFSRSIQKFLGKFIVITIKIFRNIRTARQNRYYWGVVIALLKMAMDELGNDYEPEDIHQFFAKKFLKTKSRTIANIETGESEVMERVQSTTELETVDFDAYIQKIKHWSEEILCLVIPEPEIGKKRGDLQQYFINHFDISMINCFEEQQAA